MLNIKYWYKFKQAIAFSLVLVLALCCVASASGTNAAIEEKKEERKGVDEELGDVRRQLEMSEGENEGLREEQRELTGLRDASVMEYNELVEMLRLYEELLSQTEIALVESERDCEEQLELLKARVRSMYMNTDGSAIEALLSSKDLTSFMEKIELFSVISSHDSDVLEDYKAAKADVEYKRSIQEALTERAGEKAAYQRRELDALNLTRLELEERINGLQSSIDVLASLEDELEAQSAKLEDEIKVLVAKAEAEAAEAARKKAEAERKAAEEKAAREKAAREVAARSAASGSGSGSQSSGGTGSGGMRWPAPGYRTISSAYGNRMHPIHKRQIFHSGIDIAAPSGANIIAAKDGTVIISRVEGGYGNTVVIDHGGGITTLYGHCSKLLVKAGQKVKAGDTIAKAGSTGVSTGPHLHFEVRKNGSPVNPGGYL
ncbi:MAG: peptidoglycan DD-metalloendopeptidase family protein [Oscillospiraceae bacterium]|nr:peptidoglycan DD-metalloendopeptidase family protein [Oscillospiraceae bacterium]